MVTVLRERLSRDVGLLAALLSSATFATSGTFGKAMQTSGWSAGAVVLLRVGGASLALLPFAVWSMRGRWHLLRRYAGHIAIYGGIAIALCQVSYFYALQRLTVGVALLLEYLAILVVVVVVSIRKRALPGRLTRTGVILALVGLALVLNLAGQGRPDLTGVAWGVVAALCLSVYYLLAAGTAGLPSLALASFGMGFGALVLGLLGVVGIVPLRFSSADIDAAGAHLPWWVGIAELAIVAAAMAYVLGIYAARSLGSTVASFVGLTEVLFAILFAWVLLGELPTVLQLVGGSVMLVGVVAVKLGERQSAAVPEPLGEVDDADLGERDVSPTQPAVPVAVR